MLLNDIPLAAMSQRGTLPDSVDESKPNPDIKSESQSSSESSEGADVLATKYSELKRQLWSTTNRNQQLESECAQLKRLLKDYEAGLETATSSMRLQVVCCDPYIDDVGLFSFHSHNLTFQHRLI